MHEGLTKLKGEIDSSTIVGGFKKMQTLELQLHDQGCMTLG